MREILLYITSSFTVAESCAVPRPISDAIRRFSDMPQCAFVFLFKPRYSVPAGQCVVWAKRFDIGDLKFRMFHRALHDTDMGELSLQEHIAVDVIGEQRLLPTLCEMGNAMIKELARQFQQVP